jgi:uncharacterized protein YceH (UPF0502 family)
MPLDLDRLEQRIVGVLVEKEMTVPDGYPLTLNALVSGCNQKNNREPQMQVEEYEVEGALRSLMDNGWVTRQERDGGRTHRYRHEAREQLGTDDTDLAILSELLCRGPQAPGALVPRVSRMQPIASAAEVERRLEALAARPVPYVERLERRPREQHPRWRHLLGPAAEGEAPEAAGREPAPTPARVPPADGGAPPARASDLEERLSRLEIEVEELRERLDRLAGA